MQLKLNKSSIITVAWHAFVLSVAAFFWWSARSAENATNEARTTALEARASSIEAKELARRAVGDGQELQSRLNHTMTALKEFQQETATINERLQSIKELSEALKKTGDIVGSLRDNPDFKAQVTSGVSARVDALQIELTNQQNLLKMVAADVHRLYWKPPYLTQNGKDVSPGALSRIYEQFGKEIPELEARYKKVAFIP
jgi:archaellum component FlaC